MKDITPLLTQAMALCDVKFLGIRGSHPESQPVDQPAKPFAIKTKSSPYLDGAIPAVLLTDAHSNNLSLLFSKSAKSCFKAGYLEPTAWKKLQQEASDEARVLGRTKDYIAKPWLYKDKFPVYLAMTDKSATLPQAFYVDNDTIKGINFEHNNKSVRLSEDEQLLLRYYKEKGIAEPLYCWARFLPEENTQPNQSKNPKNIREAQFIKPDLDMTFIAAAPHSAYEVTCIKHADFGTISLHELKFVLTVNALCFAAKHKFPQIRHSSEITSPYHLAHQDFNNVLGPDEALHLLDQEGTVSTASSLEDKQSALMEKANKYQIDLPYMGADNTTNIDEPNLNLNYSLADYAGLKPEESMLFGKYLADEAPVEAIDKVYKRLAYDLDSHSLKLVEKQALTVVNNTMLYLLYTEANKCLNGKLTWEVEAQASKALADKTTENFVNWLAPTLYQSMNAAKLEADYRTQSSLYFER